MVCTLISINWVEMFTPEKPILEIIVRGTVLYLGLLILMRFMPRRTGAELGLMDLIFILLITESASHSLGDYSSIFDGILMIVTMMLWDYAVNVLSYHFPLIEKLTTSRPIVIVKKGKMMKRNLRREYISEKELMAQLREQGIEHLSEVKLAVVEGEGEISILKYKKDDNQNKDEMRDA